MVGASATRGPVTAGTCDSALAATSSSLQTSAASAAPVRRNISRACSSRTPACVAWPSVMALAVALLIPDPGRPELGLGHADERDTEAACACVIGKRSDQGQGSAQPPATSRSSQATRRVRPAAAGVPNAVIAGQVWQYPGNRHCRSGRHGREAASATMAAARAAGSRVSALCSADGWPGLHTSCACSSRLLHLPGVRFPGRPARARASRGSARRLPGGNCDSWR